MRTLKFRAWHKGRKEMIAPNGGDFIGWHAMSNWRDSLEVMQYIGEKDINGVEIYEGDIVHIVYDKFGPGRHEYWVIEYGSFGDFAYYAVNRINSCRQIETNDYGDGEAGFMIAGDFIPCVVQGNIFQLEDK